MLKIKNINGYQRGHASVAYNFFDRKPSGGAVTNENLSNQELNELHKPIIRKLKTQKLYSSFIGNIWGADLADMTLLSKCNERICFYWYLN